MQRQKIGPASSFPSITELDGLGFSKLAAALAVGPAQACARLRESSREYQGRKVAGTAAERTKARVVSEAYARAAALLEELETARKTAKA